MYDVNEPGVYNVSLQPGGNQGRTGQWTLWLLIGGIVVLGLLVVAGVVLVVIRAIRRAKVEHLHKRRRQGRHGGR